MRQLKKRIGLNLFLFSFAILVFFSGGVLESEDSWLYTSVSRNLYYHQKFDAAPNEYSTKRNVNFNAIEQPDGTWKSPAARGYSVLMVPAVAISDLYHRLTGLPVSSHFPLVTDWSFHLAASLMHALWGGMFVWLLFIYLKELSFSDRSATIGSLIIFFLSNLFPLAGDSFPHILMLNFLVIVMIAIKKFSQDKKILWIMAMLVGVFLMSQVYNGSYALTLPGLLIYLLLNNQNWLKNNRRIFLFAALLIVAVPALYLYWPVIAGVARRFHPTVLADGLWGLVLSPGKGMLIFNPLLWLLVFFWFKFPKKYKPELGLVLTTVPLYLFFYGQAYLQGKDLNINPIWNGGANWGTRYMAPLVMLTMILVVILLRELSRKQRRLIVLPVSALAFYIQLLGVLVPYQVQYRGLPWQIKIADQRLDVYNYASYIPRFSPLIRQSKELGKRIIQLPNTLDHGKYQVKLFDGFDAPLYTSDGVMRGFFDEGYLKFEVDQQKEVALEMTLLYQDQINRSGLATVSAFLNDQPIATSSIRANQEIIISKALKAKSENLLSLKTDYEQGNKTSRVFLESMEINNQTVNLGSMDLPYVDYGTESWPERKYFGVKSDNWDLWYLRSGVYENSLDLWWLRQWYYWDQPHELIMAILIIDLMILAYISKNLYTWYNEVG